MGKRSLLLLLVCCGTLFGQQSGTEDRFSTITKSARKLDGFLPLYWDEHKGKMWLEIDRLNDEFFYVTSLSAGVGSNELGLDRGRMGEPKVVRFERSGRACF